MIRQIVGWVTLVRSFTGRWLLLTWTRPAAGHTPSSRSCCRRNVKTRRPTSPARR